MPLPREMVTGKILIAPPALFTQRQTNLLLAALEQEHKICKYYLRHSVPIGCNCRNRDIVEQEIDDIMAITEILTSNGYRDDQTTNFQSR